MDIEERRIRTTTSKSRVEETSLYVEERAERNVYQKHLNDDTDVTYLTFATISPELQKQHEHMDACVMIEHLQCMFEGQARQ